MTDKERLNAVMHGRIADRAPVICPGGMMNMITTELMDEADISWPEAHSDAEKMADLAFANYANGCFENVGVPFCMTVESEAMGARVAMGSRIYEPHVTAYAIETVSDRKKISPMELDKGRAKVVLDAIHILKTKAEDIPIIGNITGPISTAASVMEPVIFYRELRKKKEEAHDFMSFIADECTRFAKAQLEAGADIIAISDPSGTGEILGPKLFEEFTVKYLNRIIDSVKDQAMGTIVHICGQMKNVYAQANLIRSDVLSFDSCVSMAEAKECLPGRVLMGNVSTWALEFGSEEKVIALTQACIKNGSGILAPACGLGARSPLVNIKAIRKGVLKSAAGE